MSCAPVARRRGPMAPVLDEREEISRGMAAGRSIRSIAASLGRSPSMVSREVARHGGRSAYSATEADARAWERALRPKPCRLARHPELRWRVAQKLALDWSPEQISGWLKRAFPAKGEPSREVRLNSGIQQGVLGPALPVWRGAVARHGMPSVPSLPQAPGVPACGEWCGREFRSTRPRCVLGLVPRHPFAYRFAVDPSVPRDRANRLATHNRLHHPHSTCWSHWRILVAVHSVLLARTDGVATISFFRLDRGGNVLKLHT